MKKIILILLNEIKNDKKKYLFFLILVLVGFIFGNFFNKIINDEDKILVLEKIKNFISNPNYGGFVNVFSCSDFVYLIFIFLLGISIIGVPIIVSLLFLRSFILGFSLGSIIVNYKLKGIFFSFLYLFPHQIIKLFCFIILSYYSCFFSFNLINMFVKKNDYNIKDGFQKYFIIFCALLIVVIISIIYEFYMMPIFVELIF